MLLISLVLLLYICSSISTEESVYKLRKCGGAGCPYAAAWFVDVYTYITSKWYLHSTKMEQASFNIFHEANLVFQLEDIDAYYVHHMSMYEHLVHNSANLTYAKQQSDILSKAAFYGECGAQSDINNYHSTNNYTNNNNNNAYNNGYNKQSSISLIPFYGGLPPNVTADYKVKSLGQGNSLVSYIRVYVLYSIHDYICVHSMYMCMCI